MTAGPTDPLLAEIRRHLASGNEIEAIKHYREATGVGLAEAKDAVERIEAGKAPLSTPADATLPGQAASRIKAMVARGDKLAAIKLYRKAAGVDLKAAKEAVDQMADRLPGSGVYGAHTVERQRGAGVRWMFIALVVIAALGLVLRLLS